MKNKTLKDYQKLVASGYPLTVEEIRHAFKLYEECLEYKNSLIKHYSEQEHERIVREAKANPYPTDWHNELILNEIKKEVSQKVKDIVNSLSAKDKALLFGSETYIPAAEMDGLTLKNYLIVSYEDILEYDEDKMTKRFEQLKDKEGE